MEYPDLNPPEVHYIEIDKEEDEYRIVSGAIIGRGVAAGGGEGVFKLEEVIGTDWFRESVQKADCEWLITILSDVSLSPKKRFETVLEKIK